MARAPTRSVARAPAPRARVASPNVSLVVAPKPSGFNTFKPGASTAAAKPPAMSFKPPFGPSALLPDEALIRPPINLATPAATPAPAPVPPPPPSAGGGGGGSAPASEPTSYQPESSPVPSSQPISGPPSSQAVTSSPSSQAPASTPPAPMVLPPPPGPLARLRALPRWQKIALLLAVLGIAYFGYTKFARPKKSNPRRRRRLAKRSS
jgi:hypothetical protein